VTFLTWGGAPPCAADDLLDLKQEKHDIGLDWLEEEVPYLRRACSGKHFAAEQITGRKFLRGKFISRALHVALRF
jgi:hypothetical protein